MKIFKGTKKIEKHWVIRLVDDYSTGISVNLDAVDSVTGKTIACLIAFDDNGDVLVFEGARTAIHSEGYDASEHGNRWDNRGRLIIHKSGDEDEKC